MWNDPEEIFATKVRVWTVPMLFTCFQSIKITKKKTALRKTFPHLPDINVRFQVFFPYESGKNFFDYGSSSS